MTPQQRESWLAELGLSATASASEIKEAFGDLVRVWHPDRFAHDPRLQQKANRKLAKIIEAYRQLSSDPVRQASAAAPEPARPEPPSPQPPSPESTARASGARSTFERRFLVGSAGFVAIAVVLVAWATWQASSSSGPDFDFTGIAESEPAQSEQPIPVTVDDIVGAEPDVCSDRAAPRPDSGEEIGSGVHGGHGWLRITNGTKWDGLVVLMDTFEISPRRATYVHAGKIAVLTSIPPGNYWLHFQHGEQWLVTDQFCRLWGTTRFEKPLSFVDDERRYSRYEVTLHAVPDGRALTDRLADSPLPIPRS
jgi:curved DNA-binding protein CbpA